MMRTHLSTKPISKLNDISQLPERGEFRSKPRGFWYEVDGDWRKWCQANEPNWIKNKLIYTVDLREAKIYYIRSTKQLREFHKQYIVPHNKPLWLGSAVMVTNWEEVARSYDGLEIAPYVYECRLDPEFFWYYGWDCASGVVWNASKLEVQLITDQV